MKRILIIVNYGTISSIMDKNKKFSLRARAKSFVFAWQGIRTFFASEHNAYVHLLATIAAIALACIMGVSRPEAVALVVVMGFVWMTEVINTAIEKLVDLISPEHHPLAGKIKDLAAAAVLIASITALVTGLIIFIPKF